MKRKEMSSKVAIPEGPPVLIVSNALRCKTCHRGVIDSQRLFRRVVKHPQGTTEFHRKPTYQGKTPVCRNRT